MKKKMRKQKRLPIHTTHSGNYSRRFSLCTFSILFPFTCDSRSVLFSTAASLDHTRAFFDDQPNRIEMLVQPSIGVGNSAAYATALEEQVKPKGAIDIKLREWSLLAILGRDKPDRPTTINKDLKRRARPRGVAENQGEITRLRFRPYVSKVPWHTGVRGFLSQLFPRYGHYCGPNWSSGKDGGSLVWDQRPIDWLDFCCYCHDMGYDSHDQSDLLKADLAFLECLERPNMATKGDPHVAELYKTMCITGLKNILIPYRTNLVKMQSGKPFIHFEWLANIKWRRWNLQKH